MNGQQDIADSPTPSEIRMACRNIRAGWSESQERSRRTGSVAIERCEFPTVAEKWLLGSRAK